MSSRDFSVSSFLVGFPLALGSFLITEYCRSVVSLQIRDSLQLSKALSLHSSFLSSYSELCLLHTGTWLGYLWVSSLALWPGNSFKVESWEIWRAHLQRSLSYVTCCPMSVNYCFLYFAQSSSCLRQEDESGPSYSIIIGSRSLNSHFQWGHGR